MSITIFFIILATLIGVILKKLSRDKCLKDFENYSVTLERTNAKPVWGKLRIENTGIELIFEKPYTDPKGQIKASYILYKQEYSNIQALIRFHDKLSLADQARRNKDLKKTYKPNIFRRFGRKIKSIFKMIRDSVIEVINVLMSHFRKFTPAGTMLTSQDKYVTQIKQELISSTGTSYEALLERYIGRKVVLELVNSDEIVELIGILKDYTSDFIEIMNVNYSLDPETKPSKADLVILRNYGIVRHLSQ